MVYRNCGYLARWFPRSRLIGVNKPADSISPVQASNSSANRRASSNASSGLRPEAAASQHEIGAAGRSEACAATEASFRSVSTSDSVGA
jgi:hypothetical protein